MAVVASMQKYDSFKYSGEDWIAEIPEHWDINKLKHIFYEKKHTKNLALNCGAISFGSVVRKDDEKIPVFTKASYQEVLSGEFLINPLNLNYDLISLRIALSKIDVVVSAGYLVLKEKIEINKEYFKYLLHRYDVAYMKLLGSGVRQTISFNHIANSLLIIPSLEEQGAIARFLDDKTAQIDDAIAIKEKQIALLKERKQIIIQKAVTQGLNPNAPMKDSGVDWIQRFPAHWDVKKLKYLVRFMGGGTPSKENSDYWGGEICWVSPKDMKRPYISSSIDTITELAVKKSSVKLIPKDAVLIVVRGMILAKKIPVAIAEKDLTINQDMKAMIVNERYYSSFLMILLDGLHEELSTLLEESGHGTKTLPTEKLGGFYLPIPPKNEQAEILSYIDRVSQEFSKTLSLLQSQIEKLKEYKTTLINSAVTGKIKVA